MALSSSSRPLKTGRLTPLTVRRAFSEYTTGTATQRVPVLSVGTLG